MNHLTFKCQEKYDIVSTKIYDKRDDFDFEIVNFPFLDGDVPRSTSYGVYISQLIRFARASSYVADFNTRNKLLTEKLLKDIHFVIYGIISDFTDKGQFQYLTNLKGPQEGTYLYTTQFLSLRWRSIFYLKIPHAFMGPLYCPL